MIDLIDYDHSNNFEKIHLFSVWFETLLKLSIYQNYVIACDLRHLLQAMLDRSLADTASFNALADGLNDGTRGLAWGFKGAGLNHLGTWFGLFGGP